jgi:intracellular multiplication protein IcmC
MFSYIKQGYLKAGVFISLLSLSGCASSNPDAAMMVQNLSRSYPGLWRLFTAAAYLLGFMFGFKGVYALKAYGEARTMMSSNASLKGPMTYFMVSVALIFSPQVYHDFLFTTFGTPNTTPLSWSSSTYGMSTDTVKALLGLIQIVGVIAFIRGWLYIAKTADGGGQGNNFGKGLTHIFGGIMAINIAGVRDVLWNTFGFGT